MATKPSIQETLHEEISTVTTKTGDPAYSNINGLSYLNNFVKEVMRVFNPGRLSSCEYWHSVTSMTDYHDRIAATTHREAAKDLTLQGVAIPKGTTLDIISAVTMLRPAIWGADDVDEFDPTRWDRLTKAQASPYVFSAFSNGPRICIGKAFALMEIKIIWGGAGRPVQVSEGRGAVQGGGARLDD